MRTIQTLVAAAAVSSIAATAFAATPITVMTCGQFVQGTGQLVANLDCSASPGEAVKLQGKLLLNGFTLTGHAASDVVSCELGACRVVGPGTVTGGTDGVRSKRGARIEAGAVITANGGDGVRTDKTAKVLDAMVSANGGDGVRSKTTATISGSTITGNTGDGVRTDGSVTIKASTVGGNGGNGVDSDKNAKALKLSTINGNGFDGIRGIRSTLVDSTATGNRTNAACGVSDECADVASFLFPAVKGSSTCETSRNTDVGGTWGVCSLD